MSGAEKLLVFQRGGRLNRSERRNKRTKTEIFFSLLKKYWGQTKNLPAPQAKRRGRQERTDDFRKRGSGPGARDHGGGAECGGNSPVKQRVARGEGMRGKSKKGENSDKEISSIERAGKNNENGIIKQRRIPKG